MANEGLEPRRIAYEVLLRVETSAAFADAQLGAALARSSASAPDRGLATRLVYGTIAWSRRLDWIADRFLKQKSERLEAPVRVALRIGLFQLFFSDRIPPFAAVDTAVEVVKAHRPGAAALVNAVLRRAIREGQPEPPSGTKASDLALRWSHPEWIVRRWLAELGPDETERLLRANNEAAPLVFRAPCRPGARDELIARLEAAGARATPGRHSPFAVIVEGGYPRELGAEAVPHGEASQLVPLLFGSVGGTRWLDACAAPGGKASELAEIAPPGTSVFAIDLHRPGLVRARALAARPGGRPIDPAVGDAANPPFAPETFDAALIDAPCSGTGTLRSHPEIRWRLSEDDVADLAARQSAILDGIAPLIRSSGLLVYATCSLFRAENDAIVEAFLETRPEWRRSDVRNTLPENSRDLAQDGALRTSPARDGLDGFFAVRLERAGA